MRPAQGTVLLAIVVALAARAGTGTPARADCPERVASPQNTPQDILGQLNATPVSLAVTAPPVLTTPPTPTGFAWPVPDRLKNSPMWPYNQGAIEAFVKADAKHLLHPKQYPDVSIQIAVVPGQSEDFKNGHHRGPTPEEEAAYHRDHPGEPLITPTFQSRLEKAYQLLTHGMTQFILISGGAPDPSQPDYVEATRGRDWLMHKYGALWANKHPNLAERLLVEPYSRTTPANLHNSEKFCQELGVKNSLVITEMEGMTSQGNYMTDEHASHFLDARAKKTIKRKTLGEYKDLTFKLKDPVTKQVFSARTAFHCCIQDSEEAASIPYSTGE